MKKILREQAKKFAFNYSDTPLIHVIPGEEFEIETWDAGIGFFKSAADKAIPANRPGFDRTPPLVNPIAGPIFIEGLDRGDTLVVKIHQIEVEKTSWIAVGPNRGPLGDSSRWNEISGEYSTMVFDHSPGPSGTTVDGTLQFNDKIAWPITPFVGTLGVAPDRDVANSLDGQGDWGGNLDIRDFKPGNKIFLPVYHPGGLFYLGDVHASQGDTEFTGTAAETQATVRVSFEIIKGKRSPGIRIETPDSIIAVHAFRPLEDAVHQATVYMMDWLVSTYGFTQVEAYCFVSTCPDFRINVYQMCKIGKLNYVAGAEVPKRYLLMSNS